MTELEKKLLEQNHQLTQTVEQLTQTVEQLIKTIESLNQKIAELTQRLNKNSRNSSNPPSSDGLEKPAPKSLRKPSGRKAGGQKGHKGTNFCITSKPDRIIPHMPSTCAACPHYAECKAKARTFEEHNMVDMVIKTEVVSHQALEVECPLSKETRRGEFPEDIKARMQYGNNLKSLVVALNALGAVSINRVHEILGSVIEIPLSTGTISDWVVRFAGSISGVVEDEISGQVVCCPVVNLDGTGLRVNGKLHHAHVA